MIGIPLWRSRYCVPLLGQDAVMRAISRLAEAKLSKILTFFRTERQLTSAKGRGKSRGCKDREVVHGESWVLGIGKQAYGHETVFAEGDGDAPEQGKGEVGEEKATFFVIILWGYSRVLAGQVWREAWGDWAGVGIARMVLERAERRISGWLGTNEKETLMGWYTVPMPEPGSWQAVDGDTAGMFVEVC